MNDKQHTIGLKKTQMKQGNSSKEHDADNEDEHGKASSVKDAFHVDTDLIPQAALDEQGSSELQALGLSVFNQDDFEQGVMEQVGEALAKEEEIRLWNILQKELATVNDDILMAKKDLEIVNNAENNIEAVNDKSRDMLRQLESIKKQKENKLKQLKTLKVRCENVKKKLAGFGKMASDIDTNAEDSESLFDQAFKVTRMPKKETERERMIRTGEMTPFGTIVKTSVPKPSTSSAPSKPVHLSDYEKTLLGKSSLSQKTRSDFKRYLKKKSTEALKPKKAETESEAQCSTKEKTNRFDEKDGKVYDKDTHRSHSKRQVRYHIHHEFTGDSQLSDGDDDNDDMFYRDEEDLPDDDKEDEYKPSKQELRGDSSDDYDYPDSEEEEMEINDVGKRKRRGRHKAAILHRKKPRPLPKYKENSEEDEPTKTKVKRDLSIKRERDDADPEAYQARLLKQQRLDSQEEMTTAAGVDESGSDGSDREFDGGLRVPKKLWKKLFKYQKTGVRWLWELHCQQAGGIVGDEMGLGKTIQTIAFLAALSTSQVRNVNFPYKGLGPTIIVCPTTVMHQWLKEFHKWWPEFRVAILHSSGSFSGSESDLVRSIAKSYGILITSFNTLVIHQELILRFNWHYVILDEGHKIRNPDAKVTLCCKQFRTPHRIILSGSPIQNNLKELWSLFDFVFPGKLGTLPDFMQHFSIPIVQGGYSNATQIQVETSYRCACVLRDTINPYLIRRMKADVKQNLDLPNKNEQVLFCRLTDEQCDVYKEYLASRECNAILQGKFQVFAGLITLRKNCNHPDLSTGGLPLFRGENITDGPESQYGYYKRSGKMIVVEALLRLWYKQHHRVLLFTQSKSMLNILEKFVQDRGYRYLTLDGGTPISARQPLISQYNNDPSIYLFLLTTRVGGLGVNLTGADRVIIYDPDWNPSTDVQARERAWRIGQTRQVTIYRLLTSGTIEEKIYHRQIFKQFLTNRVLKDPKQRRLFKSQDMMDLFTLGGQDNKEGTETSALFAGTGSNVRIPKKLKKNRFDEMQEMKEEKKEEINEDNKQDIKSGRNDNEEDTEEDMGLDKEELEQMRELARKLSQKMEMEKKRRESDSLTQEAEQSLSMCSGTEKQIDEHKSTTTKDDVSDKSEGECCSEGDIPGNEEADCKKTYELKNDSGADDPLNVTSPSHKWKRNDKVWTIPTLKRKTENLGEKEHISESKGDKVKKSNEPTSSLSSSSHTSRRGAKETSRKSSYEDDRDRGKKKHKRKRKHHDAKFEGERIPHLDKHCPLSKNTPSERQDEQSQQKKGEKDEQHHHHDDYVLRQLFKKTGIQGAMKHDKIMDSGRPDYAIVEAEAERVAREAATALRQSRQQCASALSGVPTWTGQHGGIQKPRFGQKKNSLLVSKSNKLEAVSSSSLQNSSSSAQAQRQTHNKEGEKEKLFDGSISGNVALSSKNDSLSSNDLLSRIRARKRISTAAADMEDDDEFLRPDRPQTLDPKDEELLQDIRNYVASMATNDGEASTQEIVLNFGKRLPKADAPKFKAMLNQICDFQGGLWRLKADYR